MIVIIVSVVLVCLFPFVYFVVTRKNRNPKTSYLMAVLNVSLEPFRILQLGLLKDPVVIEDAMKDAVVATKLHDFGDLSFVENYKLVAELPFYKNLRFSNLGLVMAKLETQLGLCTRRLLLVDYFKRNPSSSTLPG